MSSNDKSQTTTEEDNVWMDPVNLSTGNNENTSSSVPVSSTSTTAANSSPEEISKECDDVDDLLKELVGTPAVASDSDPNPMDKFRKSSQLLTSKILTISSDIDTKLGISSKTKELDQKVGVSSTISEINKEFKIGETVSSGTKSVWNAVNPFWTKGVDMVGGAFEGVGKNVKEFDQKHGIMDKTVGTLATGTEFLAKSIPVETKEFDKNENVEEGWEKEETK